MQIYILSGLPPVKAARQTFFVDKFPPAPKSRAKAGGFFSCTFFV
jgi:hypothetical protein